MGKLAYGNVLWSGRQSEICLDPGDEADCLVLAVCGGYKVRRHSIHSH